MSNDPYNPPPDPQKPWYADLGSVLRILRELAILLGLILAIVQAWKANQKAAEASAESTKAYEQSQNNATKLKALMRFHGANPEG